MVSCELFPLLHSGLAIGTCRAVVIDAVEWSFQPAEGISPIWRVQDRH
jgi:hypothetical protein